MKLDNFVLDVDGVLTDGSFYYSGEGKLYKKFGPHDADGLKMITELIDISFISADERGFAISNKRVSDMGFELELVGEEDRYQYLASKFNIETLIFMGDGYFDKEMIDKAAIGIAPLNALEEVKKVANFVTSKSGGDGAVFEACVYIKKLIDENRENK